MLKMVSEKRKCNSKIDHMTSPRQKRGGGGGCNQKNWVGVCRPLPKTLTLFKWRHIVFDIDVANSFTPEGFPIDE